MRRAEVSKLVARIRRDYTLCLNSTVMWLRSKAYDVNASIAILVDTKRNHITVSTSEPLYCRDWPHRQSGRKRIDILASIDEEISLKDGSCTRACICVDYFNIKNKKTAVAAESLRYECIIPPYDQHPICHVDTSNKPQVEPPDVFSRSRETVEVQSIGGRCQGIRIPSAFMNLPGLLAMLAADHLTPEHWKEFRGECLHHCAEFPRLGNSAVKRVIDGQLCAWSWYAI